MSSTSQNVWDPVPNTRTYEQVMAQIERWMLDGRLVPGNRLPSEREFAQLLGISRPSLREALRVLEALGVVDVRQGRGPDGGTVFVGRPGNGFTMLLKMQLALGHFSGVDVLQTRLMLEKWAIADAARNSSAEDHDMLRRILEKMDQPLDAQDFNRLDTEFHVRIAESTGNSLVAYLMGSLRTAIQREMTAEYGRRGDWQARVDSVRHQHHEMLRAIEDRDPERAEQLLHAHLNEFYGGARDGQASSAVGE